MGMRKNCLSSHTLPLDVHHTSGNNWIITISVEIQSAGNICEDLVMGMGKPSWNRNYILHASKTSWLQ